LRITIDRLQNTYKRYNQLYDLSWLYETRDKKAYIIDSFELIKQYIDRNFNDRDVKYEYSVWGLTEMSILTVNYIFKNYPNARLMHVYDTYRKTIFEGLVSESPEMIRNHPNEIIFVTTNGAKEMALKLFSEIDKKRGSYVICEPLK